MSWVYKIEKQIKDSEFFTCSGCAFKVWPVRSQTFLVSSHPQHIGMPPELS